MIAFVLEAIFSPLVLSVVGGFTHFWRIGLDVWQPELSGKMRKGPPVMSRKM